MKKGILLLVFTSFFISEIFAQQDKTPMLTNHWKVELGFQGLGAGYEFALGKKIIIDVNAGLGGVYSDIDAFILTYHLEITNPAFYAITEFRYYYSLPKRLAKNRNRGNNAGNYVAAQVKYDIPEVFNNTHNIDYGNTRLTEVHWGIQRNLGKKFLFNLHLGLGYAHSHEIEKGIMYRTNCSDEYCWVCRQVLPDEIECETGMFYFAIGVKFGFMF